MCIRDRWHTPNSPCPKIAKMSKSKIKPMFICFFDSNGIICKEFLPTEQTFSQHVYWAILERLLKRAAHVKPAIMKPCHTALSINEFLAKKKFLLFLSLLICLMWIPVTTYSSRDLNMSQMTPFCMTHIKKKINLSVEADSSLWVPGLLWRVENRRLKRCVAFQGNYFEGNRVYTWFDCK